MDDDTFVLEGDNKISTTKKKLFVIEKDKKIIVRILAIFWLISSAFLFLRIILEAFGSAGRSLFSTFIYFISGIFMFPFFDISPHFANTLHPGQPTFDGTALMAIFCYTILVLLAVVLTYIITKIYKTEEQVHDTVTKNNFVNPRKIEQQVR